jgi:glycosyltransferase involved in cell wall biosynthesis
MKIRWHGMLGTQHSWAFTQQALIRAMKNIGGHDIFLKSTNNLEHFPDDLKDMLLPGYHGILVQGDAKYLDGQGNESTVPQKNPEPEIKDENRPYDLELAYTIPYQGPRRFYPDSKCRAIIWNFESSILPPGWQLYSRSVDYILPSSQFSYDIFANNGVPKEKLLVVPHGVDTNVFNSEIPPFKLKTKKRVKFLHNAIPHHRKLHERVIKGFVETFTAKDDVCLVLKTKFVKPSKEKLFDVDVKDILTKALKGKKNPPEIEVINTFIPDIGSLYTACDVVVSMSSTEGFWLPGLEALACGSLIIAPRHGGQLDFLNDENSILIDAGEMAAPASMQYWAYMKGAVVGDPDIEHYKETLKRVYENLDEEKARIQKAGHETVKKFTWEAAAQMILDLPIPETSARTHPKKKVLYIIPYKMIGGGEVWVKEAISRLDRSEYEPHVAFVSGISPGLEKLFEGLDIVTEDLSSNTSNDAALKCLIESSNYSIIHFYNSFGVYRVLQAACRQGLRCRIVETVHSEFSWNDSMTKISTREPFVTVISSVSNRMARKLLKMGNKNVVVLPQHVDWDRFDKSERSKNILDEFQIPKNFVVGFVGRISPEKNIPVILACAKGMPEISFVIIGDGPQESPLKQMAKDLKNVFFLGRKNDLEKWYPAFDLLILPSVMEGKPLVILEAMSAGTPVVASDVGAIIEVVFDGITGSLIWNPGNPGLFASVIRSFQTNEKLWNRCSANSKMVAAAFKEKSKSFDVNHLYKMMFGEDK